MQMQQPSGRSNFRISHQSGIGGIDSSLNVGGRKSEFSPSNPSGSKLGVQGSSKKDSTQYKTSNKTPFAQTDNSKNNTFHNVPMQSVQSPQAPVGVVT